MAQIPIPFLFDAPGHHHDHGGASLGPCTWHPNRWPLPTFGCASPAGKQKGWLFPGDLVSGGEILALDSQVMSIDVNWSVKWCNRKIQIDRRKPPTNMGFQEIDIGDVNINNSYHPWQAHILAFFTWHVLLVNQQIRHEASTPRSTAAADMIPVMVP